MKQKRTGMDTFIASLLGAAACLVANGSQGAQEAVNYGQLPVIQTGQPVLAAGQTLSVGHTACPAVIDWNNDGKKDLLVGTFRNGKVFLFLNQGTEAAPVFDKGVPLQAGGKDLEVGYG